MSGERLQDHWSSGLSLAIRAKLLLSSIDNIHFEHMVHIIYPAELQLNKANASDTEAAFLDLNRLILILVLLIFRSLMVMSLDVPLMVFIYLNLFALQGHLRMLLTSIIVTNS